ncbi:MAG: hypothetical protein IJK04_10070, partial [Kiritimatiellae bacterium]|nr:hypothetical protein [Kiritimatiellia bacterium]
GYTFSAPATTTVNGRAYTCTGYTLETWDPVTGGWGASVPHDGELSCAATETSRIRITWRWTPGNGIVTRYTTADYVLDGLVLHYDGIRNVGADLPHDSDTTVWRNLAPNGGFDMNLHVINMAGARPGEWRADGYRFENESYFSPDVAVTLPSNQTIQVALLGTSLDQYPINASGAYVNEAYFYYNRAAFDKGGALSLRKDVSGNFNSWIDWSTHGYDTRTENSSARPDVMTTTGAPFEYVTAVLADDFSADFLGTTIPTAETSRWTMNAARRNITKVPQVQTASSPGFGIGGSPNNDRSNFRGLIRNFRLYNRVLTNEELAQNRVIDEYRFHGVMPVTNVVVASSHSFLSGNEANGNYEISGAYTFSAPTGTQTDSHGIEYALDGYTLETWDAVAQGWGAPVQREGGNAFEYTVAISPAKVRLTWRWEATKGLRTAADYGLEDVVPNGLVLHYDGIKNIGAECADVTNPTSAWSKVWVNLADPGRYTLVRKNKATPAGGWSRDGYAFANASSSVGGFFRYADEFTFGPAYSVQTLLDAKVADQADGTCGYIMFNGGTWQKAALGLRTSSDYNYALYWVCDTAFGGDARPKIHHASKEYTYGTVVVDGRKAAFFDGVEMPASGGGLVTKGTAATAQTVPQLCLGGGQGATQDFTGAVKSFRYYDRALTEEEMRRNRQVDSARYFGELAFTNLVVDAGGFTAEPAAGAYFVEGSYEFAASEGDEGVPTGYKLQDWDETAQKWTNSRYGEGTSFTFVPTSPTTTTKITWRKNKPFLMIVR